MKGGIRNPQLWKLLIGAAANLNYPGASKFVGPLLDRYYKGEDVGGALFTALIQYAGKLPDEAKEIIQAIDDARSS